MDATEKFKVWIDYENPKYFREPHKLKARWYLKLQDYVSQIRYSLVVILELNGVSEVQYKEVMIIDDE